MAFRPSARSASLGEVERLPVLTSVILASTAVLGADSKVGVFHGHGFSQSNGSRPGARAEVETLCWARGCDRPGLAARRCACGLRSCEGARRAVRRVCRSKAWRARL